MGTLLILLVLAYMLVRVEHDQDIFVQLLSVLGIKGRLTRPENTLALIAGGLVFLALVVAIEPETRIFLMFLDSVGVDLVVAVCALYLRDNLLLVAAILLVPVLRGIYRLGPVPGFWPSRLVIRSSATWAGYAVVVPVVALCSFALAALCVTAVFSTAVRLLW
jgi:hypothetical protein